MSNSLIAPRGLDDPSHDLPEGWAASRLTAKCEIFGGGRLGLTKEKDYRSSGVTAFSAAGPDGHVDAVEIDGRDGVVLSAIGANCGRCFFASGQWTTLANVQAIIPKDDIDAKYLFYYVNRDGYWTRSGSAQPFIKPSSIQSSWVAYPPSKPEQSKIAEVLSTVDRAIAQTEGLIAKQQRIKTGLMQDLLTRGIDQHGQLRSEATHAFKDSPLGRIPVEWEVKRLSEVVGLQVGYAFKSSWFSAEGVRLVRGENVGTGTADWNDTQRLPAHMAEGFSEYLLSEGDLIIGMDRTFTKQGFKVTRLRKADVPSLLVQRVGRYVPLDIPNEFMRLWIQSPQYQRDLLLQQKGMDIPHLSKAEILSPSVPLPNSIAEMERIGDRFRAMESLIGSDKRQLNKLSHLKTALMQDLLTGKVRVTPLLPPAEAARA